MMANERLHYRPEFLLDEADEAISQFGKSNGSASALPETARISPEREQRNTLTGKEPPERNIQLAAQRAGTGIEFVSDLHGSVDYR